MQGSAYVTKLSSTLHVRIAVAQQGANGRGTSHPPDRFLLRWSGPAALHWSGVSCSHPLAKPTSLLPLRRRRVLPSELLLTKSVGHPHRAVQVVASVSPRPRCPCNKTCPRASGAGWTPFRAPERGFAGGPNLARGPAAFRDAACVLLVSSPRGTAGMNRRRDRSSLAPSVEGFAGTTWPTPKGTTWRYPVVRGVYPPTLTPSGGRRAGRGSRRRPRRRYD